MDMEFYIQILHCNIMRAIQIVPKLSSKQDLYSVSSIRHSDVEL